MANRCTVPGRETVTGLDRSATRIGLMTRWARTTVPSGATSYSFTKATSIPPGPAAEVAVGEDSRSVAVGMPTTSTARARGPVDSEVVAPGASVTGWDWSRAEVSV